MSVVMSSISRSTVDCNSKNVLATKVFVVEMYYCNLLHYVKCSTSLLPHIKLSSLNRLLFSRDQPEVSQILWVSCTRSFRSAHMPVIGIEIIRFEIEIENSGYLLPAKLTEIWCWCELW